MGAVTEQQRKEITRTGTGPGTARVLAAAFELRANVRLVAAGCLLAAATLDRYTVEVMGATVKLEHLALVGVWAVLVLGAVRWGWRLSFGPLLWLLPFLTVLFLSSAVNAPDRATSLRQSVLVLLVSSGAVAVYCLASTPVIFRKIVQIMMVLAVAEAALALILLGADRFGLTIGAQPGPGDDAIRVPFGTLWEPNVLGSYLTAAAMLFLSVLLAEHRPRRRLWLSVGFGVVIIVIGLSLARASWFSLVAGAAVVVLLYWRGVARGANGLISWTHNVRYAVVAALAAVVLLVGVASLAFPATVRGALARADLSSYKPSQDPALQTRAWLYNQAFDGILAHPIIGNGAGSFAVRSVGEKGEPSWLSNLELHLLYDSGLIGLCAVLGGIAMLLWKAVRALGRPLSAGGNVELVPYVIGVVAAVVVLLITYQTTEATWLAYTWPYVGLLARAANMNQLGAD